MASGGQRAAESSTGRRVTAIEEDEITPYVITNEIGKGKRSLLPIPDEGSCISGSFATVYRGYHQVSDTNYRFRCCLAGIPLPSAPVDRRQFAN